MPDSLVVTLMRRFKADLLANEATVQYQMAQRWLEVERALEAQILALTEEVSRLSQEGAVSQRQLYDLARYQSLLAQLQIELRGYTQYANALIEAQQAAYGLLGRDHAVAAIEASYIDRVAPSFDRLPVETVQSMVGLTGSGTPLRQLLEAAWPDAADGLTQELIRSTALGLNPRDTARRMADGTTRTLNRMLVIARTEQLRVYRETSRLQYQQSGVVSGYRRIATRDSRTCAGCLAADGREYGLNEEFAAHPQCRCALLPIVIGMPPPEMAETTRQWFERQSPETQREILGPGRYDLWRSGQAAFDDFAAVRHNPVWGDSIVAATVQELTAHGQTA